MNDVKWRLDEPTEMPDGAYFDDDGFLHDRDGHYLPDGIYITEGGVKYRYEMFFLTGRFELLEQEPSDEAAA